MEPTKKKRSEKQIEAARKGSKASAEKAKKAKQEKAAVSPQTAALVLAAVPAVDVEPKPNTLDHDIWFARKLKAERETVAGFVRSLGAEQLALLEGDALAENCGKPRVENDPESGPKIEQLAVLLLKHRLQARISNVHRISGSRHPKVAQPVINRIGLHRLLTTLRLALEKPGANCIVASKVNPMATIEIHYAWPKQSSGLLVVPLKHREGSEGFCDSSGDLTEDSLRAYLLGLAQPPGKIGDKA